MKLWRYGLMSVALVAGAQQKGINFYSVEKEIQLGAEQAIAKAGQTTPIDNPAASAYVDLMVKELERYIPNSPIPYAVTIVREGDETEPVVLMGGHVFISVEQIRRVKTEGEFVGMLAQAMARVANRDASRKATRIEIQETARRQAVLYNPAIAQSMPQRITLGAMFRTFELEADQLAAKVLMAARYSPAEWANYIERTATDDGIPGWQPFRDRRVTALREAVSHSAIPGRTDSEAFLRMRESLGK